MKNKNTIAAGSQEKKIAALVRTLRTAERDLHALTGGHLDAVAMTGGKPYLLDEAQERLRLSGEAQRQGAETQAAILNALSAHVALLDSDGMILIVNESWRRFAIANDLQDPDSAVGQNYLHVCERARGDCSEVALATANGIRHVLQGKARDFVIEYPCDSPKQPRWFHLQVTPLHRDRLVGALVMHVDITERKQVEEALRESETRFRGTFEQAAVGIAHVSADGSFLRVNDKLCDIVGYGRQELLGMTFVKLTMPEDRAESLEARDAMLAGKLSSYTTEKRYRRRNGDAVWTNLVSTLERTAEGVPKYFISVVEDITTRKLAEFRLNQLNRLHSVLSRINETIARVHDSQEVYETLCRLLVEGGLFRGALIVEVDPQAPLARVVASFGTGPEYLRNLTVPTDRGLFGRALRTGIHYVCNDIAGEARMEPWENKMARQHGFRSTAYFPLKRGQATIGALVLYADELGYFHEDEIHLMDAVATDLSFGLEAQRQEQERQGAETALRISQANMTEAQRIAHFGSWELDITNHDDIEANPLRWSDEMFRITGYEPGAVEVNSELFFRLIPEDEHELIREAVAAAIREHRQYSIIHRFIRSDGEVRVVSETAEIVFDEKTNLPFKLIGTCQDITESRKAENALQTSEKEQRELARQLETERARLVAAQSVSKVGSWETDLDTMFINWSAETHRIYETDPAAFLPTPKAVLEFIHPADRAAVNESFVLSLNKRSTCSIEHRVVMRDGRIKFVNERWQTIHDESGKPVRAMGTCQDITERKCAEQALEELSQRTERRERMLSTTLSSISDFAYILDREGRFLLANQPLLDLWGITVEEAVGKNFFDLGYPDDLAERLNRQVQEVFDTKKTVRDETPYTSPAGLSGYYEYIVSPAFGADGAVDFVVGIARDTTGPKRAAEALRASLEEFRTLAEAMPQMVWMTRPDGWNIYFNQHWMDYTGLTLEESLGHGWNKPFHPEDQQRAWHAWQNATATIGIYSIECRLLGADGLYRWWLIRGVPLQDAGGKILKWFGTCTDIHDLKLAELEISRTNRALKVLSSCNEVLFRTQREPELLNEICRIAVEIGEYRMAWVGYAQDDKSRSIMPLAYAGVEEGYLSEIKVTWKQDEILGNGPVGEVIRTGQAVVCKDVTQDLKFVHWLALAQQRGYRGVICLPLRDAKRTFGVLVLYSAEVIQTSADELKLLQDLADNLAFGIGNLRAQSERGRLQDAVVKVAAGVSAATGTEFFEQLARNMAEALGVHAGFVAQVLPGEPLTARTVAAVVEGRIMDNFDYVIKGTPSETLLTSDTCAVWQLTEQFPGPFSSALGGQGCVGRRLSSSSGQLLGILFVIFREPLKQVEFITSTLQIFAARAASELERQQTDARVREQAALLDIAHEAIQVKDLEGRIIYWNKGAERTFGWTADEVLGRKSLGLLDTDYARFGEAQAVLLVKGEWQGEMTKRTKDGRDITVEVRWTLVRDAQGRPKSILAINRDITEKKKLESQFLRAQRMESIGTLAGGIAHDLNNVFAPIMMSIAVLKTVVKNQEDLDLLTTLETSANRGADLVKQVLSFARGVEGQRITVNPIHLIQELLNFMQDTFPKSIDVRFTSTSGLWMVTGDPTQMHQVFLNLCVNARDAMSGAGMLDIHMENALLDETYAGMSADAHPGAYVMVKVSDNGTGIEPEARDRIFEPFFTTKEIGKGTGLGLSTTLAIVKSHGGFIHLYSEVGTGTQFKVYLPANTTVAAADRVAVEPNRLPRGNGELVLVVDDEEAIRKIAKRTLERFGYRVLLAGNGVEAVALYAQRQPDIAVVLTDMAMPIMDGPALIVALTAMNPHVRIIACSGNTSSVGVSKAVGAGVEHFIPKPYTAEAMLKTLQEVLRGEDPAVK